jgi:hypothetical protein
MSPQRPASAARNTDEIMVPGRIGVVVASCVLTAGASATERLPRRVHPARSPGQATWCTGPVVDPRIDTRPVDWRNGFEPPTGRTPGNNHTASDCDRTGQRLPIGKERFGHSASTVGFQRRHCSSDPPQRAEPKGKREQPTVSRNDGDRMGVTYTTSYVAVSLRECHRVASRRFESTRKCSTRCRSSLSEMGCKHSFVDATRGGDYRLHQRFVRRRAKMKRVAQIL